MPLMPTILGDLMGVFLEDLMATFLGDLKGVFLANQAILDLARRVKAIQATMATVMRRKTLVANVASKSWKVTKNNFSY